MKDLELVKERRAEEWRDELRKTIKTKERTNIPRAEMPALDGKYRARNHEEVSLGLTPEMARIEASRCIDCANPTCMDGCPVSIHIPTFLKNIERGDFLEAARVIRETSSLPGVCGRVCPQEKQCECSCFYPTKLNKEAVAIGFLERFAADAERNAIVSGEAKNNSDVAPPNGIKVAIVGSGPAGLSVLAT